MARSTGPVRTSRRMDWVLAGLSAWLVGGFYIDLWAHGHGEVDNTFLTPWHGILYAAAAAFGIALGVLAFRNAGPAVRLRASLPVPYRMSFGGFLLFGIGGVVDLAWHSTLGFEVGTATLLSPPHLLLATAGLLMLGGPLRSAAAAMRRTGDRSWSTAGPFVVALAMGLAILGAFTQYVHPIVDPWAQREDGADQPLHAQLYAMDSDGMGQRRLAVLPGDARVPRFSPDGTRIAYGLGTTEDNVAIHVMSADGSDDVTLTTGAMSFGPAWSPDGDRLAFALRNEGESIDLYVMDADGTGSRRLTDDPAEEWGATWTPDGQSILFNSSRGGDFDLYRVPVEGGELLQVTSGPGNDWEPSVSPDGARLAFTSDRDGEIAVWTSAIDGSSPARLDIGEGDGAMPVWSPDGARIAFVSWRTNDAEIFVVPATGGEPANLTRNPGIDDGWAAPTWSADGTTIAYPVSAQLPAWREPFVREGFGAAGVLVVAALLAGGVVFARRRGRLPLGGFTVLIAVPLALMAVIQDEWRFLAVAFLGGLLVDLLARGLPAGASRRSDALFAFAAPAVFFALYFLVVALTNGIGWQVHMWLGAIFVAGVVGLLVDEVGRRPGEGRVAVEEFDQAPVGLAEAPPAAVPAEV